MNEAVKSEAIPLVLPAKAEITPGMRAAAVVVVVGAVSGVIAMTASGYWLSNFTSPSCP